MEVPIVYLDIIERLYNNRNLKDMIRTGAVRNILGMFYHFKRENHRKILIELQSYGLIEINHQWITVKWIPSIP